MIRFIYFYGPVKIAMFIIPILGSFMLLSSALLAVISLLIFDFSWLVGFLFNFLNFVWSSRIFCSFEW